MDRRIEQNESPKSTPERVYAAAEVVRHSFPDAAIAVRVFGAGPNLALIHGFPTHGYTWRKLLPELSRSHTCYVVDLPGLGDSDWSRDTDFGFRAQAQRLCLLFDALKLDSYSMIAHDTGATIARLVAASGSQQVLKLVAINTEIPGHRPPWIPAYQVLARLPGANRIFRITMRSKLWQRSSLGFRQFYTNRALLNVAENLDPYVGPVTRSKRRMQGLLNYLVGIDWSVVDELPDIHSRIKADTLLLWGEEDKTFPAALARDMLPQFGGRAALTSISGSLLPHEETPARVLQCITEFLAQ